MSDLTSSSTMKAAQYTAPGEIDLVEVPLPVRAPGQVLLRMEKVACCGTDLHLLYDKPTDNYPFPPGYSGHECVGVIEESDTPEFSRRDWVLVIPPHNDAFAEYLSVDPKWLIPLPRDLKPELGLLAQLLGTVIHCCLKLSNVLDKVVVVVGEGPVGLLFTALLYSMGAKRIIGLDLVDHRLEVASRMGAAHTLNVSQIDPVAAIDDFTNGKMADVVIEAAGETETINLCPSLLREGGELALFGVPRHNTIPFVYEQFLRKQLRTISSAGTQAEPGLRSFRLALDLIAQQRINVSPLISHRLPFAEVRHAFWLAKTRADGAVKVILDFEAKS